MKRSLFAAYGGLLTACSIVLLLLASVAPGAGWGLCISAGMLPAIPLAHRQVRLGVHIYAATALLAFLVVPGKRFAVAYAVLFGVYAGCVAGFLLHLLRLGILPLAGRAADAPHAALVLAFLIAFVCYDVLFSKIIALFRIFFRDR